ncbi:MAG: hypothetical protein EHM40_08685 [Chloroflexi bacterium]|nr:MAG: hypothetical protein EHM40_08685 [Chloroflexota bacterium]
MNLQHINIKFFIENPEAVKLEEYSGIFNNWIQRHVTAELLIDVADYLHVHNGPGILLIGHEADYSLDNRAGRLGLLYNRKAQLDGSVQEKLAQAAGAALTAARLLEKENGVKFSGQETQLIINDRLLAPNTRETFAALEPDLRTFFDRLYNGTEYTLTYASVDPRERFTVDGKVSTNFDVETLLKNLSMETAHA